MKFGFVHAERANYPVAMLCRVMDISRSGYYRWKNAAPSRRQIENLKLKPEIAAVHEESRKTYGSPRIHAELVARGYEVGRNRVARLMRELGLSGAFQRRFRRSPPTGDGHSFGPDLVKRNFRPPAPNRVWASDISYVKTEEGWVFLAVVLDLFSRKVVGWAMNRHMRTSMVLDALHRAIGSREVGQGLIHHSDRGVQFTSRRFKRHLEELGIKSSMGETKSCYDNAAVESLFATLKKDLTYRTSFRDLTEARSKINAYINLFYNSQRRHSGLGYLSPIDYEKHHQMQAASAA